jgi:hypothetical protein
MAEIKHTIIVDSERRFELTLQSKTIPAHSLMSASGVKRAIERTMQEAARKMTDVLVVRAAMEEEPL